MKSFSGVRPLAALSIPRSFLAVFCIGRSLHCRSVERPDEESLAVFCIGRSLHCRSVERGDQEL